MLTLVMLTLWFTDMSRPSTASSKPAMSQNRQTGSSRAKGLKDIRIDEEVKIAVHISLERFQYSDQKGSIHVVLLNIYPLLIQYFCLLLWLKIHTHTNVYVVWVMVHCCLYILFVFQNIFHKRIIWCIVKAITTPTILYNSFPLTYV